MSRSTSPRLRALPTALLIALGTVVPGAVLVAQGAPAAASSSSEVQEVTASATCGLCWLKLATPR